MATTTLTPCVKLDTGSWTLFKNVHLFGAVSFPPEVGREFGYYIVNLEGGGGAICDAANLFDEEGVDEVQCLGADAAGPDLDIESWRHDLGDPETKKVVKQLTAHVDSEGSTLDVYTFSRLDDDGTLVADPWPVNDDAGELEHRRSSRFIRRGFFFGFRIRPTDGPGSLTRFKMGPFGVAYKLQRQGKVDQP